MRLCNTEHPCIQGMGATYFLPRLVGQQMANYMLLTGDTITGEEAAACGMVFEAVEKARAFIIYYLLLFALPNLRKT